MYEHLKALDINAIRRQPKNTNSLQLNEFRLVLHRTPKMIYFCQEVYFPGVTIAELVQPTPFSTQVKRPSNKLDYENLDITFIVSEDMENWKEIRSWMVGLTNERDFVRPLPENERYSDATLILMSSSSTPFFYVTFQNCFPVSLSGIQFSSKVTDITPATAALRLAFSGYEIQCSTTY